MKDDKRQYQTTPDRRSELHDRILRFAINAFAEQGLKAVKMDYIARQLGISKRTLYEIYDTKETMLLEGIKLFKDLNDAELHDIATSEGVSVIDIILYLYKKKVEESKRVNPLFYTELSMYPHVLSILKQDQQVMRQRLSDFIERGENEGYFRTDTDRELFCTTFEVLTAHIMNSRLYQQYSVEALMRNMLLVALRGICTRKGVDALDSALATIV